MRFGVFEFRPASRELYRGGARVRLQAQPAQVLGLLLRHAGQGVTGTELKEAVWGPETFGDFDKGLNFCIAQVRTALGDSADAPIYMRTIAKHGYQFIAPVAPSDEESGDTGQVVTAPTPVLPFRRWWLPGLTMLMVISGVLIFGVGTPGVFSIGMPVLWKRFEWRWRGLIMKPEMQNLIDWPIRSPIW